VKGVDVVDEAHGRAELGGDYVQFFDAGTLQSGDFQCSDCGYGVAVQVALPRCPMCAGATWERVVRSSVRRTTSAGT
jgi:rubredoxin